mgnify:CR=1 FL=1
MSKPKKSKTKGVTTGEPRPEGDWYIERESAYQVRFISVTSINTENQLVRADMDSDHVIELSNSIAANGLLEPIVVREYRGGYQLIAGAHRLAACKRMGWSEIPAHILPVSNTAPIKSLALIENIIRRDLSLEEECAALKTLSEEQGLSTNQICDLLGKSRIWVQKRLFAPTMPDDVRQPLWDGLLSFPVAEILCEVEDEGTRKQLVNQAVYQKLGSHAIRQIVDVYREAPTLSEAVQQGIQAAKEIQNAPPPSTHCGACGRRKEYTRLKPIFICIDVDDCQSSIMREVHNADNTGNTIPS